MAELVVRFLLVGLTVVSPPLQSLVFSPSQNHGAQILLLQFCTLIHLHSSNSMFSMPESKSRETWLALAFKPQDCAGSTSIFCTGVRGAEARGLVGEVAVGEVAPTTSCFSFSAPKADNRASRFLRISSWSGSLIPAVIMLSERVATLQSYTAGPGCTLSPYEACKRPRWLPKEAAL